MPTVNIFIELLIGKKHFHFHLPGLISYFTIGGRTYVFIRNHMTCKNHLSSIPCNKCQCQIIINHFSSLIDKTGFKPDTTLYDVELLVLFISFFIKRFQSVVLAGFVVSKIHNLTDKIVRQIIKIGADTV